MNEARLVGVEIDSRLSWERAEEVTRWLASSGGEGWICLTGEIARIRPGTSVPIGPVLAAELCLSERESVHIRLQGARWNGWRTREVEGTTHRAVDATFLSSGPAILEMRYTVYWARSEDHGFPVPPDEPRVSVWRPHTSRFAGFTER